MKTFNKVSISIGVVAAALGLVGIVLAATFVSLGTADSFAILAGSTITNTGNSVITGDLGLSPGTSVTGFPPGTVSGTQHVANATALAAQNDLVTAYNNAAGQTPVVTVASELGAGTTKTPGVYDTADGELGLTGIMTLDAQGDADAVFIFKAASTLTTGVGSNIVLANGAQACNVFWQIGSSATLGTNSTFKGSILAMQSITLTTGANVEGRILARNGAVTMDNNIVTKTSCVVPPPPPAPVPAPAPGPVSVPAQPGAFGSGDYWAPLPLINVTKIPTPLALPSGAGSVTYAYVATNIGIVPMRGVWVTDDKCNAVNFVSGDTNSDSLLDVNESWLYKCTKTVSKTEMNTATAHGQANGWDTYDTANATVVVGLPLTPPLIHVVKKPSVFILPIGGGPVTYNYTVTNPGKAPLSNVSIIDDKCTGLPGRVIGHPGDLNKNNLLESNEAWSFTCQTNLTQTTTNIGTAEGTANGLTAIDFSPSTVVVRTPGLPNTGFSPEDTSWNTILLAGILAAVSASLVISLRKRS